MEIRPGRPTVEETLLERMGRKDLGIWVRICHLEMTMEIKLPDEQYIGFAGLASHEKATIDLAQRVYPSCLNRVREITDLRTANVIFADPDTVEGRSVLEGGQVYVIAVQDRRGSLPPGAQSVVYRPVSPRAVLEALNQIDGRDSVDDGGANVEQPHTFAAVLHDVMSGARRGDAWLLFCQDEPALVLEPVRDRVRGGGLEEKDLPDGPVWTARSLSSEAAKEALSYEAERPLCRMLWSLARGRFAQRRLFAQENHASFRFKRWPNLSAAGVSGEVLRAISLLRHGSFDVSSACRKTRLSEQQVTVLFNASWLNGDLVPVAVKTGSGSNRAKLSSGVNSSVLARIRNRLAGV